MVILLVKVLHLYERSILKHKNTLIFVIVNFIII
jgi:hypothetical protein